MAIIEMTKPWEPGTKIAGSQTTDYETGNPISHLYGLRNTYIGCCIQDRERNMRDDSDFYMLVWDGDKPKEICYASTRGWSYPCYGSAVDATPEILAKYEAWKIKTERAYKAADIRIVRKQAADLAAKLNIPRKTAFKLMAACIEQSWRLEAVTKLLTGNLRSEFKKSLRTQVQAWLANPERPSPLSPRQWPCLNPAAFREAPRGGYNAISNERANRPLGNAEIIKRMAQ